MYGAIGDGLYNFFYLLHMLAVIVGTGAAFLVPVLSVTARKTDNRAAQAVIYTTSRRVVGPSLFVAGIFGSGLVGLSDDVYDFSQGWLSAAFAIWIVMLAVCGGALWPVERRLAGGQNTPSESAELHKRASMFYGILHLSITVMLIVMIWGSA